jgi:hypothetical protein
MDYIELAQLIRNMKPRSKMYRFLKAELLKLDRWQNKPRGNPSKGLEGQICTLSQG